MKHSIVLGKELVPDEQPFSFDDAQDDFDAFEKTRRAEVHQNKSDDEMVLGKLYELYKESCRGEVFIAPMEAKNHVCSFKCNLVSVVGHKHKLNGYATRWHICLGKAVCHAPEWMHANNPTKVGETLFVCKHTMCAHVCDAEHCNAEKVTTSDSTCCSATGRVLSTNPAQFSHGWVEDEWRHHTSHATTRKKKPPTPAAACGGCYQYKECTKTLETMRRAGSKPCYNLGFERKAIEGHIQEVYAFAEKKLRQLLPGSPERVLAEKTHAACVWRHKAAAIEKHFKRLPRSGNIEFHALSEVVAVCNQNKLAPTCYSDPERMDGISKAYSEAIVDYIRRLSTNTGLEEQEVTLSDLICAMVYLLRESFILDDCALITPDVLMLHYLPPASSLPKYGYKKNNFTTTKTAIKTEIVKCIKVGGVAPWRLVFHPVPLAKALAPVN